MSTLFLDCGMGAAGDMLTAALYELLDKNEQDAFIKQVNNIGIDNVTVSAEPAAKCGIQGTHISVRINGEEEDFGEDAHEHEHMHEHNHEHTHEHEYSHDHEHSHDEHGHSHDHEHSHDEHGHSHNLEHTHHHIHRSMSDVEQIIDSLNVSENVKKNTKEVYKIIAEAESHVHGVSTYEIHFHEVGSMDAISDVASVCLLMELLKAKGVERIVASPVHVGSGKVRCAHGILPVPAPATAHILSNIPVYSGEIKGELCTPTGAALLKYFVNEFSQMPVMTIGKIGYGMGKKDFPSANCVRAILGSEANGGEHIVELTCNVDDMDGERVGFAMEKMFEAGAVEVYTVPVGMKKSRPGIMFCVMCREDKRENVIHAIFKYTTTLGIRENISRRYTLERSISHVSTKFGDVGLKISSGYGVERRKYEYEDLAAIASKNCMSIDDVIKEIEKS